MKQILQKMKKSLMIVPALLLSLTFAGAAIAPAYAANCDPAGGLTTATSADCSSGKGQNTNGLFDNDGIIHTIINLMLFIIGILCVVMIIWAGIRYTTSTGDKGRVTAAKDTLVYSIVGLIVAILAYAIMQWVFTSLSGGN